MSNKIQSSIEWLEEQIKDIFYVAEASEMTKKFKSVYEQAKQMHKEEIEDALEAGYQIANEDVKFKHIHTAEQYYNEAFRETKN